jgi:serine/threonine-protein kinase
MARFEREAKVLASLNHPNIAQVYGVEEHALVMELVEGESPKGPLPIEDAWKIASQIASALEYAHERGIIHRDLKPANVKVTPDGIVKLLDFGLAKAFTEPKEPSGNVEQSPTLTIGATEVGVILGTAAYMAPEQAKGKSVDKRADIWAFGVVLYELLTGDRLFKGENVADTLAQVLTKAPDLKRVPAKVRRLLQRCLEKDPKQRLRDIGVARDLLDEPAIETAPSKSRFHSIGWMIAAGALALALAGVSWIAFAGSHRADPKPLVRLNLDLPTSAFALSPDGTRIVYAQPSPNGLVLATRLLSEPDVTVLAGTEGVSGTPFFSPDGQLIGFFAAGQLKTVSVRGGAPIPLAPAILLQGASWGRDGSIVAALKGAGDLSRVPDTGGRTETVVSPAEAGGAIGLYYPQLLPGGRTILFTAQRNVRNASVTYAKNLTTGETQRILENVFYARYLATGKSIGKSGGHLVYVTDGTLFARPFDPGRLALLGPPQPVLSGVAVDSFFNAPIWSFSDTGDLVYQSGQAGQQTWPVQWMDGSGTTHPLLSKTGSYVAPRFSPDPEGRYLALQTLGEEVLVYDWKDDVTVILTKPGQPGTNPAWSPDGKYLAIANSKGIAWVRADGSSEPRQILEWKNPIAPSSISPDGKYLTFREVNPETSFDVWVAPLDLTQPDQPVVGKPEPLVRNRGADLYGQFSPDGKWLAYTSDESGTFNVYVRPFPGPGAARNVSVDGGVYPAWSKNGHELLFQGLLEGLNFQIMTVDYRVSGGAFIASKPRAWSNARIRAVGLSPSWALHPDGKRIAMFPPGEALAAGAAPRIVFVQNFFDEVRRRAPAQ